MANPDPGGDGPPNKRPRFADEALLNSLNDSLPDELMFDNDASSSSAPQVNSTNPAISTMAGGGPGGPGNMVVAAGGGQPGGPGGGQAIRPPMPPGGTPTSVGQQGGVVTNGIVQNDVSKSTVTSTQQPIMVQQQVGPGPGGPVGMRPNGPGQAIVSNPNISLVNTFGANGPQTVKMTAGGSVVSNGPLMTVSGGPPLAPGAPDGGLMTVNSTMNNGQQQQLMGQQQQRPPNMPSNIIGGRAIMGNQPPGPVMGRMVRPGNMIGNCHTFQRQMGPAGAMVQGGGGPPPGGMPPGMNPRINMRMQAAPPGGVMVGNQPHFVGNQVVNTSGGGPAMQMTANGQLRPTQIGGPGAPGGPGGPPGAPPGGIPGPNGPQVNMPPQYQNAIESTVVQVSQQNQPMANLSGQNNANLVVGVPPGAVGPVQGGLGGAVPGGSNVQNIQVGLGQGAGGQPGGPPGGANQPPGARPAGPPNSADPEERRLIQQQLVLLLHAHKCQRRDSDGTANQCDLPHCKTMKGVLNHIPSCRSLKDCQVPHCSSSRQIINHWKHCARNDCPICLPLRQESGQRNRTGNPQQPGQVAAPNGGLPGLVSPPGQGIIQPNQPNAQPNATSTAGPMPNIATSVAGGGGGPPNGPRGLSPRPNGPNDRSVMRAMEVLGIPHNPANSAPGLRQPGNQVSPRQPNLRMPNQQQQQPGAPPQLQQQQPGPGPDGQMPLPRMPNQQQQQQGGQQQQQQPMGGPGGMRNPGQMPPQGPNNPVGGPSSVPEPSSTTVSGPTQATTKGIIDELINGPRELPPISSPNRPPIMAAPMPSIKEWHATVQPDLRNHLVHKLVQAIFPTPDPDYINDIRMHNLVAYARKVESDMYGQANSRSEYCHLLAEKIYKIQKELEEKRQRRKAGQQQPTPGGAGAAPGVPNNPSGLMIRPGAPGAPGGMRQPGPGGMPVGPQGPRGMMPNGGPAMNCNPPDMFNNQQQQQQQGAANGGQPVSTSGGGNDPMLRRHLEGTGGGGPGVMGSPIMGGAQHRPNGPQGGGPPNVSVSGGGGPVGGPNNSQVPAPSLLLKQLEQQTASEPNQATIKEVATGLANKTPSESLQPTVVNNSQMGGGAGGDGGDFMHSTANANAAAGGGAASGGMADGIKKEIKSEPEDVKPDVKPDIKQEIKQESMDTTDNAGQQQPPIKTEADIKTEVKKEIKEEPGSSSASTPKPPSSATPTPTPSGSATPKPPPQKPLGANKVKFTKEQLKEALEPPLMKMHAQEPEAQAFRLPVDPATLNIPDYFEIIKKPMDMSAIKQKLDTGAYNDPWEFVDDVWLMFENAWIYNRKTSRVYKWCSKLAEIFEADIDPVMQKLGYCCGKKHTYSPQTLCCYGNQNAICTIARDSKYFVYENKNPTPSLFSNKYNFCQKCFNDVPGNAVPLGDDPAQPPIQIDKSEFKEMKNDVLEREPFVTCQDCGRKLHQICVLHLDSIWRKGFICDSCHKSRGTKRVENKFTAKRLPTTRLGQYIENRVNNFLRKKEADAGEVHIRVVFSGDKTVEVKPLMKQRFVDTGEMPATYPYRARALFAFEEIDGVDVCFFGMHVQEYGSECPAPNTRRVYIAYLDSVHFFKPRVFRTSVYHEILLGYLEYMKKLGYTLAHIWACPPSEGDDYIFHCHPPDQKIPKPKRLQDWYKKMLVKGIIDRIVFDYKDIYKQAIEDSLESPAQLPYFEGDFWPNVLEENIREQEQEEVALKKEMEERERQAAAEAATKEAAEDEDANPDTPSDGKKSGKKKNQKKKKSAAQRKNNQKKATSGGGSDLTQKMFVTMDKHKDVFFTIRLHSVQGAASLSPITDPDPLMPCDLMDGRDAFLAQAREKHLEFSSLRRCAFSTMILLYELHTQGQDKFVYTCNSCSKSVETRYHCQKCEDFDLCVQCYEREGHPHRMEKLGFDLDGEGSGDPHDQRKVAIQRCIQSLVHACQCRDANCRLPSCQKMKRVVQHTKQCKRKSNGGCPICKQLIALCCYHAKLCEEPKCPVPFCQSIKQKLKQQQMQQRLQNSALMRRRIAQMNHMNNMVANANRPAITEKPGAAGAAGAVVPANAVPGAAPGAPGMPVMQQQNNPVIRPQGGPMQQQQHPGMAGPSGPMMQGGKPGQQQQQMRPQMMGQQPHPASGKPGGSQPGPGVMEAVKKVRGEAQRQQQGQYGKEGSQMVQQAMNQGNMNQGMPPGGNMANNMGQQQHMVGQPGNQWGNMQQQQQRFPGGGHMRPQGPGGPMQPGNRRQQRQQQQGGAAGTGQPGQPGVPKSNKQSLEKLIELLKSPQSPEQHQQVVKLFRSNPSLMAAFLKQKNQQRNRRAVAAAGAAGAGGVQAVTTGSGGPQGGGMPPQQQLMQLMNQGGGGGGAPMAGPAGNQQGQQQQQMGQQQQQQQQINHQMLHQQQQQQRYRLQPQQGGGNFGGGNFQQPAPPYQRWTGPGNQQNMLRSPPPGAQMPVRSPQQVGPPGASPRPGVGMIQGGPRAMPSPRHPMGGMPPGQVQNDDSGQMMGMPPGSAPGQPGQMNPSGPNMNMGGAAGNLGSMLGNAGGAGGGPGGPGGGGPAPGGAGGPGNDQDSNQQNMMTPQDQLSKFVETL